MRFALVALALREARSPQGQRLKRLGELPSGDLTQAAELEQHFGGESRG